MMHRVPGIYALTRTGCAATSGGARQAARPMAPGLQTG